MNVACLLGRHAWLTNPERTYRTCMRLRCSWGKDRLGCRHFWRGWRHRHLQLYTNACRPCRAAMAHRTANPPPTPPPASPDARPRRADVAIFDRIISIEIRSPEQQAEFDRLRDVLIRTLGLDWRAPTGFPDGWEVAEDCAEALWTAGFRHNTQLAQDPALTRRAGNDEPNPDPHEQWGVDMGFALVPLPTEDEARRWVQSYEDHPEDDPMPTVVRRTVTTTAWERIDPTPTAPGTSPGRPHEGGA